MLARNKVSDFVRGEIENGADPEEMRALLLKILKESFEEALSIKIIIKAVLYGRADPQPGFRIKPLHGLGQNVAGAVTIDPGSLLFHRG